MAVLNHSRVAGEIEVRVGHLEHGVVHGDDDVTMQRARARNVREPEDPAAVSPFDQRPVVYVAQRWAGAHHERGASPVLAANVF